MDPHVMGTNPPPLQPSPTTITHPMVDTKRQERRNRGWRNSAKTIVTAAEWYTRRRHNPYRSASMGSPPPQPLDHHVDSHLHYSSPQNLRKSGDMWGFSTQYNQPVRSYDDAHCLICPIGHIGWAQVNIATAILGCWGRTRPWQCAEIWTMTVHSLLKYTFVTITSFPFALRRRVPGRTSLICIPPERLAKSVHPEIHVCPVFDCPGGGTKFLARKRAVLSC